MGDAMRNKDSMTQTTITEPHARDQDRARREGGLVTSFKPVALPALAAAVQAVRPRPCKAQPKALPVFLREAELG